MGKILILFALAASLQIATAIRCWKCDNAMDHDDCIRRGRTVFCKGNQHGCFSEVRYHVGFIPPIRITKRCKQGLACGNNVGQNEKGFFPFQCNPHIPESICRCCCDTDDCNKVGLGCLPSYPECRELNEVENGMMECHFGTLPPSVKEVCRFRCDPGYELVGAARLECKALSRNEADWDNKEPTCIPKKCMPEYTELPKGFVFCTDRNNVHSVCDWECEQGYYMKGEPRATCMESQNWDYPPPECRAITCPPPLTPLDNSRMECTNGNHAGSTCSFTCDPGYVLQGQPSVLCSDDRNGDEFGRWSDPVPKCVQLLCQPQSRNPANGKVSCTNANFGGSECTYSCDNGFAPSFVPPVRMCEDDGDGDSIGRWSQDEPECDRIRCIPHFQAPENGRVECDDQNFLDSVCEIRCDPGLTLVGQSAVICMDDGDGDSIGVWSDPPPTCELTPCEPEFTFIDNGVVSCSNRNNYQSTCTFTCNKGYYMRSEGGDVVMSGTSRSVCEEYGFWSQQPPVCEPIKCQPPQREDEKLAVDCSNENNYLSICKYSCKDGTTPEGPPQTICQDDGNGDEVGIWEPPNRPSCRPQICQPPQINPQNGRVVCTNENYFGSSCSFSCNPGFYLSAVGGTPVHKDGYSVDCGKGAVWTGPAPECRPIVCLPKHVNPNNGEVKCTKENNYLSRCDFKCDTGYDLVGMPESICTDTGNGTPFGEWSTPPPTCENAGCSPPLNKPENGRMTCSDGNNYKSVCSFSCNIGYYLVTAQGLAVPRGFRSQCQADNTWTEPEPSCQPITCPPARSPPKNGFVECTNTIRHKSVCTYSCQNGYKLSTNFPSTVCEDDGNGDAIGKWSRPAPKCNPTSCSPKQVDPDNGKVSCTNGNQFGSVCSFKCNAGYYMTRGPGGIVLSNDDSTECLEGSRWSKSPPKCAPITCLPPHRAPIDGSVLCTNRNFYKSTCTFKCDSGYDLSGAPKSTCNDDGDGNAVGEWSEPPPTCSIGACTPPRTAPKNGRVSCNNGNDFGSVCEYTCNPGYYMVHSKRPVLTNDLTTKCQADKTWSRTPPTCEPIKCLPPHTSLLNGDVDCSNSNWYQSECTFTCDNGYNLIPGRRSLQTGSPYFSICQEDNKPGDANGRWSDEAPTCERGECNPPRRNPRNGKVSCTDENFMGSVCTYTCNVGFYMLGDSLSPITTNTLRTTCRASLLWDVDEPQCLPITCQPPHRNPLNGDVSCTNRNNHLSQCTFECDPGYDLSGAPKSLCEDDGNGDELGEWSNPPPTCSVGAYIPPRTAPVNGRVNCDNGNEFGSTCVYACNPGYYMVHSKKTVLSNDIATRCRADKTWSREPPTCAPIKCQPPYTTLKDGSITCTDSNWYKSVCDFTCDQGFNLVPPRRSIQTGLPYTATCEENNKLGDELGDWSDDLPSCERARCVPPRTVIRNGKVSCTDGNRMGSVCSYECDLGYYMVGDDRSTIKKNLLRTTCLRSLNWDVEEPTCQPITCEPPHDDPNNGRVTCTNDNFHGSVCTFTCDDQYQMEGKPRSTCEDDGNGDEIGEWSQPPPRCVVNFCDPTKPRDPVNGYKVCTDANNLGSVCEFACDPYHRRVGPLYSRCQRARTGLKWSHEPPKCEEITCKRRNTLAHGRVSCSKENRATSVCNYECTSPGYSLHPPKIDTNVCLNNTKWDKRKPCCTRPCPPNAEMDAVFVLDSSSSVGSSNFLIMKDFVRGILAAFTVADDASRFAVMRYNAEVDQKNLILLKDFTNSKSGLLDAYDAIPYSGTGTKTGKALQFVADTIFRKNNGDRPNVPNLVIVMTDGRSQDEVKAVSDKLRREYGAFIFVVGIKPPNPKSKLDMGQLLAIAGGEENLMLADQGFEGLTGAFALELTAKVCGDPCVHRTHGHATDDDDDNHHDDDDHDDDR